MADIIAKFVSQKINKIRWKPTMPQSFQQSDLFVTGSSDNDENKISLWSLPENPEPQEEKTGANSFILNEGEPKLLYECPHVGDITDLEYFSPDHVIVGSSSGDVTLLRHHRNSQTLGINYTWSKIHRYKKDSCPCTSIATRGEDIVSTGEDGTINVLHPEQRQPVRILEHADSCSINAVTFLKQYEVITVNSAGHPKIWDLRLPSQEPAKTFILDGKQVSLCCVDKHPNQPHIVATGGEDGMLSVWDMRQEKYPITLLEAHKASMWEVKFHPTHPHSLFSCSEDGTVLHWDGSGVNSSTFVLPSTLTSGASNMSKSPVGSKSDSNSPNPWLSADSSKSKLEITSLLPHNYMPINSLDIEGSVLLCGSDGEAIHVIRKLIIR